MHLRPCGLGLRCETRQPRRGYCCKATFQDGSSVAWQIGLPATSEEADAIVLFGGDGTLHRHLPQLVRLHLPVLIVPRGSGNDFARALGIPVGTVRSRLHRSRRRLRELLASRDASPLEDDAEGARG